MLEVKINSISLRIQESFKDLISDISFNLPANTVYTILGKNGSGKSTLIKSLTGLLDSRFYNVDGKSIWKGKDLLKSSSDQLIRIRREEIRYVFQDSINSLDPLKKSKYYFDNSGGDIEKIDELLSQFQLPHYKTISGKHAYELSGGMLQRLNFVLALSAEPELIILDEPTSAIDDENISLVLNSIKEFAKQKQNSVLIVTQNICFAESVSDKIAFLGNGKLTEFISTNDFMSSNDHQLVNFLNAYKELSK